MGSGCSCSTASRDRVYTPKLPKQEVSDNQGKEDATTATPDTETVKDPVESQPETLPQDGASVPDPGLSHAPFWIVASGAQRFSAQEQSFAELVRAAAEPERLPETVLASISNDIPRTFFSGQQPLSDDEAACLRNALLAMAVWDTELAYCQGLNYIVAFIIRAAHSTNGKTCGLPVEDVVTDADIFWLSACLMKQYGARGFFLHDTPLLKLYGFCMSRLLAAHLPQTHKLLCGLDELLCFKWFGTLFTTVFPQTVVLRVLDAIFHNGLLALFRVGLATFLLITPQLLDAAKEGVEAVEVIGPLQRQMAEDPNPLLQSLASVDIHASVQVSAIDAVLVTDSYAEGSAETRLRQAAERLIVASESFNIASGEFDEHLSVWRSEKPQDAACIDASFSFSALTTFID